MTCCFKLAQTAGKVKSIAEANVMHLMRKMQMLPKHKCDTADRRLRLCRQCQHATWMTWAGFWKWVDDNGGKVTFFKQLNHLADWPMLPKADYAIRRKLFCRICKCWLPAKSYAVAEQCPLHLWPSEMS